MPAERECSAVLPACGSHEPADFFHCLWGMGAIHSVS
jgi:hypothetical protein